MNDAELYGLAERVGRALQQRQQRLASAESCTGGWIAESITAVPGSSEWFECGVVVYSNRAKQQLLGVPAEMLERQGAVSEETVRAMAAGVLARTDATLAVAVSGIAGPAGGTTSKPVGTVCIAWLNGDGDFSRAVTLMLRGTRQEIRRQAVEAGLRGLLDALGA
jgi:nicotinamide-nucleotide amidase